ncbi:hypothetical protein [Nostoc sp.]|uniref:hypothetical protein n=1 Tax=Nostoc sp. TaxID=1180 RepID=UPI002FF9C539
MESMLFTTLTAYEEASLSGGNKKKKPVPPVKTTPTTPATPKPILSVIFAPIVTQVAINTNTGAVKGDLTQVAVNQITLGKP